MPTATAKKPGKKAEPKTGTKPGRTRRGQPKAKESQGEAYTEKEKELRSKHQGHDILPQSYRVAGSPDRPGWGVKHTVLVACPMAGCTAEPRCVATSDLQWGTTKYCLEHAKIIKSNRRRTRETKKKL